MKVSVSIVRRDENADKARALLFDLFEDYASKFLPRLGSKCPSSEEFRAFFRYQLATYLCMKKNYILATAEGDMVSDLILDSYEEVEKRIENSDYPISQEGRTNILMNTKIFFPCQYDSESDWF